VLVKPENLPHQAFYPVANYRRAGFSARRDSQPPVIPVVGQDKYNKMFCLITSAAQIAGLELEFSDQPQVLGES